MRGGGGIRLKYGNPMPIDDVAVDFPDMPIIMAHPSFPWQDEAISICLHKPQVYIDLSGWSPKYFSPTLVQYANTLLKQKVMFGSDYPLLTPGSLAGGFREAADARRSAAAHPEGERDSGCWDFARADARALRLSMKRASALVTVEHICAAASKPKRSKSSSNSRVTRPSDNRAYVGSGTERSPGRWRRASRRPTARIPTGSTRIASSCRARVKPLTSGKRDSHPIRRTSSPRGSWREPATGSAGTSPADEQRQQFERGIKAATRAAELQPEASRGALLDGGGHGRDGRVVRPARRNPLPRSHEESARNRAQDRSGVSAGIRRPGTGALVLPECLALFGGSKDKAIEHLKRSLTLTRRTAPRPTSSSPKPISTWTSRMTPAARRSWCSMLPFDPDWTPEDREFKQKARELLEKIPSNGETAGRLNLPAQSVKSYAPQGGTMTRATRAMAFAVCTVMLGPALGSAQQVVGKGVEVTTPDNIKWVKNAAGTQETAVLFGDPAEGRPLRDAAAVASRQHEPPPFPPERSLLRGDRPARGGSARVKNTIPRAPCPWARVTYVLHKAGAIHYDGAKKEPA